MYFDQVSLNIKNEEVMALVDLIAAMTGETKTEAVRQALLERKHRLARQGSTPDRRAGVLRYLETEVWPTVPEQERGRRLTRREEDAILGYGPDGT